MRLSPLFPAGDLLRRLALAPVLIRLTILATLLAAAWPTATWADTDAAPTRSHTIVPADYFTITTVGNVAVSPDGHFVAYTESRWLDGDAGRERELWVVARDGGSPLRLTFGNLGPGRPQWSPDGHHLYFLGRDRAAFCCGSCCCPALTQTRTPNPRFVSKLS